MGGDFWDDDDNEPNPATGSRAFELLTALALAVLIAGAGFYIFRKTTWSPIPGHLLGAAGESARDWPVGKWMGRLNYPGGRGGFPLVFTVYRHPDGSLMGKVQSPEQGFGSVPVNVIEQGTDLIQFEGPMLLHQSTFEGRRLGRNEIIGQFRQDGDAIDVTLERIPTDVAATPPITAPPSTGFLDQFAGDYNRGPTTATVRLENGALVARSLVVDGIRLEPKSGDVFFCPAEDLTAIFGRDASGKVDRVNFRMETGALRKDHIFRKT
ncbi:MAG: hypothetical protein K1X53_02995 [Candidatus Sumerlaeaceae bacterium]|nr:hypothetical protein [Candidatus Sumerlaeaceae bacterium]